MTAPSSDRLFAALDATWPAAAFHDTGPWRIREGRGGGKRVSAATATDRVAATDIARAEVAMRGIGQCPLFQIRDRDGALDGWLAAGGYDVVDPVTVYLASVTDLAMEPEPSVAIAAWPPLAIQREIWAEAGIGPERTAVMDRAPAPRTAFLGRRGDAPAGTGFLALDGEVAMLHALEVMPAERRRGVGGLILSAAAHWAAQRGARWLALAVTTANAPANALYLRHGMEPAARYHYRRAAEAAA